MTSNDLLQKNWDKINSDYYDFMGIFDMVFDFHPWPDGSRTSLDKKDILIYDKEDGWLNLLDELGYVDYDEENYNVPSIDDDSLLYKLGLYISGNPMLDDACSYGMYIAGKIKKHILNSNEI